MHTIVVIGGGQLGSRHVQGVAKLSIPANLVVIDPSPAALELSRERFEQVADSRNIKSIRFLASLEEIREDIDLAILATTANVRAAATRELLRSHRVNNIIFEKILFQREDDFDDIAAMLDAKGVKAWVNCPRRAYPFYQQIKALFGPNEKISFSLHGGEPWALAGNAIHFIDLIAFFTGNYDIQLNTDDLDREVVDSPRKGFIELTGTLRGYDSSGTEFSMHCRKGSTAPHSIAILGSSLELILIEDRALAIMCRKDEGWKCQQLELSIPYQSDLTNIIALKILQSGTCDLSTYEESTKLHKPFLKAVLKHMEAGTGATVTTCPIT